MQLLKKIHIPDENTLLDSHVGVVCVLYCHRFDLSFCLHFAFTNTNAHFTHLNKQIYTTEEKF